MAVAPGPLEPQQVRLPQRGRRATRRARRPRHHAHGKHEIVGYQSKARILSRIFIPASELGSQKSSPFFRLLLPPPQPNNEEH